MILSKIKVLILKFRTKSTTLSDLDRIDKLIKNKGIIRLEANTLYELQLLSEIIFSRDDLEMLDNVDIRWSWRSFKKVWAVEVRRVSTK